MVDRRAILHFEDRGTQGATARVHSLADSLDAVKRRGQSMAPVLRDASAQTGVLGAISQSAAAKVTSLTNTVGPLGAGLGFIARSAPQSAQGLVAWAAGAERASLMARALNTTILAGTSVMLAGSVAAVAMADDVIRAGDTYATLHARIRTFSEGAIQAAQVERELYQNAKEARTSIEGQATLYTRLAPAVRDYGKAQEDALQITKLVSKAQAIQGADIREQLASTIQFSQSVASGVLRGDELRSMLESSPQLLRYIAANLEINGKVGVAFSSLRNLGKEGVLTTEKIINALLRAAPQIEADFVNAPKTAQQGWKILTDQVTRAVGQIALASGAQAGLVDWLTALADKADAFRQKMLMDPSALDPLKQAAGFMGDALGMLGQGAELVGENFDHLVHLGQLIIALKLGDVFATWFATGAAKLKTFSGEVAAFQAQSRFEAGAAMSPVAANAARNLRGSSIAMDVRATELAAQAELKLATATSARLAADKAAVQASLAKASATVSSATATEAEALATALETAAVRAEEQAKKAQTAATTAASAAAVRNTIALEAEAAVTANVTRATLAQSAAMRIANGLYTALGGAVGIATLAIGALIYALWRAEEAHRAVVAAERDALVVSGQLERIATAITSATWAQVPALLAQAQAVRDGAAAAREKANAELQLAQATRSRLLTQNNQLPPTTMEGALAFNMQLEQVERTISEKRDNLSAAARDKLRADIVQAQTSLNGLTVRAGDIQNQLRTGKDAAGRPLSDAGKASLEAERAKLFTTGQAQVDAWSAAQRQQQAAIAREKDPAKKAALNEGLKLFGNNFQTAAELVSTSDRSAPAIPSSAKAGKAKAVRVPAPVNQALTELIQQQYLPTAGRDQYSLQKGVITDKSGAVFTARSEDEAAAAAKYVKQIEAINKATDAQIEKTGKSRQALREAASAMLAHEVATSKASAAEEKWADIQAEMTGQSRAVVKAQAEVNDLIDAGAQITAEAAKAYVDYVAAREKGLRMQAALQDTLGTAREAFDTVTAGVTAPTDHRGVVDPLRAARQLEALRGKMLLESERRIREELDRRRATGGLTQQKYEQELADRLATNKLAVETTLQDKLLELDKDRLNASRDYAEQRYGETADTFITLLEETRTGAADAGKHFIDSLLTSAMNELIYSPLRKAIIDMLRSTFSGEGAGGGAGGGGGIGGFFVSLAKNYFGNIGGGATASGSYSGDLETMPTFGGGSQGNPPFVLSLGRRGGGWVHGPGGPTGDKINARLSDGEHVTNARSAKKYAPILDSINAGTFGRGYAEGGWHGTRPADVQAGLAAGPAVVMSQPQLSVQVNDYTAKGVRKEVKEGPGGIPQVNLYDSVGKGMIQKAGSEGHLFRAIKSGPTGPRKRG